MPRSLQEIASSPRPSHIPLSYAQQRLWFVDQLEWTRSEYNGVHALRLKGELDCFALKRALTAVVERHENLRTRFVTTLDGRPAQVVSEAADVTLTVVDRESIDSEDQWPSLLEVLERDKDRPFDLARQPVFRACLVRLATREHVLALTIHHIAWDGWSHQVFNRELLTVYDAFRRGRSNPLSPLTAQYADYAVWEREQLEGGRLADGLAYWTTRLAGIPERLTLPTDRPRPSVQTFGADRWEDVVPSDELTSLKRRAKERLTTLYTFCLAALALVLARYANQDDVVIGTPMTNRRDRNLHDVIGLFVNTLAMRVPLHTATTLGALVDEARQQVIDGFRHQDFPFERLVEALAPPRSVAATPLFQVLFNFHGSIAPPPQVEGLGVELVIANTSQVRYDLELVAYERRGELALSWVYNRDLFDRSRIEQMGRHYRRVLDLMGADLNVRLDEISLLSEKERTELVGQWHDIQRRYWKGGVGTTSPPIRIQDWWHHARHDGSRVAITHGDRRLTYEEVHRRSSQIASAISSIGAPPESFVGLCAVDPTAFALSMLAAVKAGYAFVPLDPALPDERIRMMIDTCDPRVVIVDDGARRRIEQLTAGSVIAVEECAGPADGTPTEWRGDETAFAYFTSGSTGRPKAVLGTMASLDDHVSWAVRELGLTSDVRGTQLTRPAFCAYLRDVFLPLSVGGTVCIPDRTDILGDGKALVAWLVDNRIEALFCVPTVLRQLLGDSERSLASSPLRYVLTAGEALRPNDVRRWLDATGGRAQLINMYGLTETTLAKLAHRVTADDGERGYVSIGGPIPGAAALVADESGNPCPPGVTGEMWIWTPYLGPGYYGDPELTARRFVRPPFAPEGSIALRTGDLARMSRDRRFEYVGRQDTQVKIRGSRIELGEIEAALVEEPGVVEAAVVAADDGSGEPRLVAYIVGTGEADSLRRALQMRLTSAMIPSRFVFVERLPQTATGKIDRRSLPDVEPAVSSSARKPATPLEAVLCDIFADILGRTDTRPDDNFFELGGHSLLAMRLVSRLRAIRGGDIPLQLVFENPTVAALAARIDAIGLGDRPEPVLPLRPDCDLPALFCIHGDDGSSWQYSALLPLVGKGHSVYGLQAGDAVDETTVRSLAQVHAKSIAEIQPEGPYYIFGRSIGGTIAHEVACLLQAQGRHVDLLAMFDSLPSRGPAGRAGKGRVYRGDLWCFTSGRDGGEDGGRLWSSFVTGAVHDRRVDATGAGSIDGAWCRDIGPALAAELEARNASSDQREAIHAPMPAVG